MEDRFRIAILPSQDTRLFYTLSASVKWSMYQAEMTWLRPGDRIY